MKDVRETVIIDAPAGDVFAALRGHFELYLSQLPGVSVAGMVEMDDSDAHDRRIVVDWEMIDPAPDIGGRQIPDIMPNRWRMYSIWSQERLKCDWRIQTFCSGSMIQIFGVLCFEDGGDGAARCSLAGMFSLDVPEPVADELECYLLANILAKDFLLNEDAIMRLIEITG